MKRYSSLKSNPDTTRAFIQRNRKPLSQGTSTLKRSKLKARSDKKKAIDIEFDRLAKIHKQANPFCAWCALEGRQTPVSDTHHKRGRGKAFVLNLDTFISLCRICHDKCKSHPVEALAVGMIASQHPDIEAD